MSKPTKAEKQKNVANEALTKRTEKILGEHVRRGWIRDFNFTEVCRSFDKTGIDLIITFLSNGNKKTGKITLQEKRRFPQVAEHLKRYPSIPAYLLKKGDSKQQVEYIFIAIYLTFNSFDNFKKGEILKRRQKIITKADKRQRVFFNEFSSEFLI